MMPTILSILVIAGIALIFGAWMLYKCGAAKLRVALMLIVSLVLFANVAIWTVPMEDGDSPVERISD